MVPDKRGMPAHNAEGPPMRAVAGPRARPVASAAITAAAGAMLLAGCMVPLVPTYHYVVRGALEWTRVDEPFSEHRPVLVPGRVDIRLNLDCETHVRMTAGPVDRRVNLWVSVPLGRPLDLVGEPSLQGKDRRIEATGLYRSTTPPPGATHRIGFAMAVPCMELNDLQLHLGALRIDGREVPIPPIVFRYRETVDKGWTKPPTDLR